MQTADGPTEGIDWIIVGGESGPGARSFDLAWARAVVAQCRAAHVPVFVKQMGARPHLSYQDGVPANLAGVPLLGGTADGGLVLGLHDRKGGDMNEWPADLRVREWPEVGDG